VRFSTETAALETAALEMEKDIAQTSVETPYQSAVSAKVCTQVLGVTPTFG
jgi:hypothetical protein